MPLPTEPLEADLTVGAADPLDVRYGETPLPSESDLTESPARAADMPTATATDGDVLAPASPEAISRASFSGDALSLPGADASFEGGGLHGADAYTIGPTNAKWGGGGFGSSGGVLTWSMPASFTTIAANFVQDLQSEGIGTTVSSLSSFLYSGFETQLRNAFNAWSQVANVSFIQVQDSGGAIGTATYPDIRIFGLSIDGDSNTLAYGLYPGQGAISGEIFIDTGEVNFWNPTSVFLVLAHEIGHALGLDHEFTGVTALMDPYYNPALSGPQADDIAGMRSIYGTAQPGAAKTYTMASGQTTLSMLDGIANLTVVGNSLANTITGTSQSETFNGGAGNDTMVGGGGNDTYYVDSLGDVITEGASEGTQDWVYASVSGYTLVANVEFGTVNIVSGGRLDGNSGDNALIGSDAADQLYGFGGFDQIAGGLGNDTIDAGAGNDIVGAGAGDDTITGGLGNDTLYGQGGNNSFMYTATGWGADTITDFVAGASSGDVLNFTGAGLAFSNFTFAQVGANTVMTRTSSGDSITLNNVTLANMNAADFAGLSGTFTAGSGVPVTGTTGNDTLTGTAAGETITGLAGNDTMTGSGGNDTFQFASGWGEDTITDFTAGDILSFTGGTANFANFHYQQQEGTFGRETLISNLGSGGGSIVLRGVSAQDITAAIFSGVAGTFTPGASIMGVSGNDTLTGTGGNDNINSQEGNDVLSGGAGDDSLLGGADDDTMTGGSGQDSYFLPAGSGDDTITDFVAGSGGDILNYDGQSLSFAQLLIETVGSNTRITNTVSGDTVLLQNVARSALVAANFASVSGALPITINGTSGNDTLTGTSGADTINGLAGNDTINGLGGADTMVGGAGNDTYYVDNLGDVVTEGASEGVQDWVYASVSGYTLAANVEFGTLNLVSGGRLDGNSGDNALIGSEAADQLYGLGGADALAGGGGNDTIDGGAGNDVVGAGLGDDTITGGLGDDTLYGQGGNNSFMYTATGWGADTITDFVAGASSGDVLNFTGAGLSFSDFNFAQVGANTVMTRTSSSDSITLNNVTLTNLTSADFAGLSGNFTPNAINGTSGNDTLAGTANADTISGLGGNDTVTGGAGDDTITGGLGDDSLSGQGGNDSFMYGATGWGADTITDFVAGASSGDVLNFTGAGLSFADFTFVQAGANTVMTRTSSGDSITLNNVTIANLTASDFTGLSGTFSPSAINGTSGNDTLTGTTGVDTIIGGAGDDTMTGNGGNDIYRFEANWGHDRITDLGPTFTAKLAFDVPGLNYSDLSITQVGPGNSTNTSLIITRTSTGDSVQLDHAIYGWFSSIQFSGISGNRYDMAVSFVGTTGNESLTGSIASEVFTGLAGDDSFTGNGGNDTFKFGANWGHDTISDFSSDDSLDFSGLGLSFSDFSFVNSLTSVTMTNLVTGDSLLLLGKLDTYLTTSNFIGVSGSYTPSVATVTGTSGNDTLTGSTGGDAMSGGLGDDVYTLNNAYDSVIENANEGIDTVRTSIAGYTLAANVENLEILYGVTGAANGNSLDNVITGNSSANVIDGGDGNDIIYAGGGSDVLQGGNGDDTFYSDGSSSGATMTGGAGNDTFVLQNPNGFGSDAITDFQAGAGAGDVLNLAFYGFSFADLVVYQSGADTIIRQGMNRAITLQNFTATNFSADDFSGISGVFWQIGSNGDDALSGGSGNDTLLGNGGNDTMAGGAGNDVFTFRSTWGNDVITDFQGGAGAGDVLRFADDLMANFSDLTFSQDGADALINLQGQSIRLSNVLASSLRADDFSGLGGTFVVPGTGNGGGNTLIGGSGPDTLVGLGGNDTLLGNGGNDTLNGGADDDTITGGAGNDAFIFEAGWGHDIITDFMPGAGTDDRLDFSGLGLSFADLNIQQIGADTVITRGATGDSITLNNVAAMSLHANDFVGVSGTFSYSPPINGTAGDNSLTGTAGSDTINGLAGDDFINGLAGADFMSGGLGDDTYMVDDVGDQVRENLSEGTDWVLTTVDYTLGVGVEVALVNTSAGRTLTGNSFQNALAGNIGNDILLGNDGDDLLGGDLGNDTLTGGAGRDSFLYDATWGADTITDFVAGASGEVLDFTDAGLSFSDFTFAQVGANTVMTRTSSSDSITLNNVTLTGLTAANFTGLSGTFGGTPGVINGTSGNDTLTGTSGADTINGLAGNDTINGLGGADTMVGGAGNDTYYVDNLGDVVTEGASEGVQDWVYASVSGYTLAANVEFGTVNIVSGGRLDGNSGDNALIGSEAADQLYGLGGADALAGGGGNDTIDGGAGNDVVGAGLGDDTITGGLGDDTLYGQGGNNSFMYTATGWGADTITDFVAGASSGDVLNFTGAGLSFSNFTFAQVGANTVMTRTSSSDSITLNSVTLTNLTSADFAGLSGSFGATPGVINGTSGNDTLTGTSGADTINGLAGNDTINGLGGADTMIGGAGNDTYYVDNLSDVVTEGASEGVQDWVYASVSGYTLAANVEFGTVNIVSGGRLDGNGGDNALIGSEAADQLYGLGGADALAGGGGNDTIDGGAGNDTVGAGAGDDTITGGLGDDTLYGQGGNNSFMYTATGWGADTIIDFVAGSASGDILNFTGAGLAFSDFTFAQVGANTVMTRTSSSDSITLNSVSLTNLTAGDFTGLSGTFGATPGVINGTSGNDTLTGTSGADTINGLAGNDTINGLGGADTMVGGAGNDTYYVDNLGDVITEGASEGAQDWVYASVSGYTLAANVEFGTLNLVSGGRLDGNSGDNALIGSDAADQLYGFGGFDQIAGGLGNDTIDAGAGNDIVGAGLGDDTIAGGLGDDTLYGQGGNNLFVMTGTTNADTIMDFVAGDGLGDRVQLLGYGSFSSFSDVQAAMTMSGGSAVLNLGGGNQITFANVAPAQFAADDFLFA